jgi:hypothetical protein
MVTTTDWTTDQGVRFPTGKGFCLFASAVFRPALGHEANLSPPPGAEVKNAWGCTTTISTTCCSLNRGYVFTAWYSVIRGCIKKFPDWPPGATTANGTALCHKVQLYSYFVSQYSEFCRHNPLCCFSTSVCCKRIFRYWLSPESFGYNFTFHFTFYIGVELDLSHWKMNFDLGSLGRRYRG